ncbi:MAG: hypothetical protein CMK92_01915 [Pseudomonas sp.]|nr:hypothetical protein [Pseudomonas sp.]
MAVGWYDPVAAAEFQHRNDTFYCILIVFGVAALVKIAKFVCGKFDGGDIVIEAIVLAFFLRQVLYYAIVFSVAAYVILCVYKRARSEWRFRRMLRESSRNMESL